jgi:hypothetical protein
MFAGCLNGYGDWTLLAARLTLTLVVSVVAVIAAIQSSKCVRAQRTPGTERRSVCRQPVVPCSVWGFVTGWSVVYLVASTIRITGCSDASGTIAVLLNASLAWIVAGLLAVIWIGLKEYNKTQVAATRMRDVMRPIIEHTKPKG